MASKSTKTRKAATKATGIVLDKWMRAVVKGVVKGDVTTTQAVKRLTRGGDLISRAIESTINDLLKLA